MLRNIERSAGAKRRLTKQDDFYKTLKTQQEPVTVNHSGAQLC